MDPTDFFAKFLMNILKKFFAWSFAMAKHRSRKRQQKEHLCQQISPTYFETGHSQSRQEV